MNISNQNNIAQRIGLSEADFFEIVQILKKNFSIEEAIIFGSRAKGNFENGSDIDLALKGDNFSNDDLIELSSFLNEETLLPYKFDLLIYNNVKNIELIEHINRCGIVIYKQK